MALGSLLRSRLAVLATASLLGAAALLTSHPGSAHPHSAVPEPEEIVEEVMDAMGGQEAWDKTRFLRFRFDGRRTHWWDKATGRHRLEEQTGYGERLVVLDNVNSGAGLAWLDGRKAEGGQERELLAKASGAWSNDSYWLLMPYKLQDPGVSLSYVGEETIDSVTYDKLLLRFSSGDRYWAFVNRETHLMDRWAYVLGSMGPGSPPTAWRWEGWKKYGNILLASKRVEVGGDRTLEFSDLAVFENLPDAVFTEPGPVASQ